MTKKFRFTLVKLILEGSSRTAIIFFPPNINFTSLQKSLSYSIFLLFAIVSLLCMRKQLVLNLTPCHVTPAQQQPANSQLTARGKV